MPRLHLAPGFSCRTGHALTDLARREHDLQGFAKQAGVAVRGRQWLSGRTSSTGGMIPPGGSPRALNALPVRARLWQGRKPTKGIPRAISQRLINADPMLLLSTTGHCKGGGRCEGIDFGVFVGLYNSTTNQALRTRYFLDFHHLRVVHLRPQVEAGSS